MQNATTLKEYRKELQHALDDNFLRATMDAFAVAYRGSHAETHSLLLRAKTRTRRFIQAEHSLGE